MRIGYVFSRPIPSSDADTQQVLKMVDALASVGADIDLLVASGTARQHGGAAAFEAELKRFYSLRGLPHLALVPGPPATRLGAERPWHSLAASQFALRAGYELIYTRNRTAAVFSALRGTPVLFETYRKLGDENPPLVKLLARLARRGSLLGIVTHSQLSADSIAVAGFPRERLAPLHNGYDPDDMLPALSREAARAALQLPRERALVCYAGDLKARKGIGTLLDLAALTPEVDYLLAGGRPEDGARVSEECRARGLHHVRVLGFRPIAEVRELLYAADVLIIPPSAAPSESVGRTVVPLKLFMYLAAGRPILAPATRDVMELLTHRSNALLTPPDDVPAAAAAIRELLRDRELAGRLEQGALATAAGLTWRARATKLLDHVARWRQ